MTALVRRTLQPAARAWREGRAWTQGLVAAAAGRPSTTKVSFGHRQLPSPDEPAVGGIVKLQSLSREFPNSPYRFNVLYLVTSRLPDGAVTMARWAKRAGARIVINQNGVAYPAWHGPGWEAVNEPMRALLGLADHVFYQSEFCRLSADKFVGATSGTWEVLHNAVDVTAFAPRTSAATTALTLLLGGSQDQWYRYAAATETLAHLVRRGIECRMIVTGRMGWTADQHEGRARAEAFAREHGVLDRIEFTGPYSQSQAPEIYRRADILVHTKYNDPCPAVVVEALATGLPVAFSASGGVPELVGDAGVGLPVALNWDQDVPPDPVKLADAVQTIAANRADFSQRARRRAVDHLNLQHWLDRHRAVFAA